MYHSLSMCRVQRVYHLNRNVQQFSQRKRPLCNPVLQSVSVEEFHHQEGARWIFVYTVKDADVWVVQCRCRASFAPEAFERLRIGRCLGRQELQRHTASEPRVFGFIDHAHPTRTEFCQDAVMRNGFANHR
jgi:hypothetical protein